VSIHYHPAVEQDVSESLKRYDSVSQKLGEEFKSELRRIASLAEAYPARFHQVRHGLHRANLIRFPYHFIYREIEGGIRVILVRHHRRHPDFGMERE
jgi:plasmid stabilization system protein ParE